jgi:hypothetical protein
MTRATDRRLPHCLQCQRSSQVPAGRHTKLPKDLAEVVLDVLELMSSIRARSANACAPMPTNMSYAVRSCTRAWGRRLVRRSHPRSRDAHAGGRLGRHASRRTKAYLSCLDDHSIRRPLFARAITKRWISEVPSKIVWEAPGRPSRLVQCCDLVLCPDVGLTRPPCPYYPTKSRDKSRDRSPLTQFADRRISSGRVVDLDVDLDVEGKGNGLGDR